MTGIIIDKPWDYNDEQDITIRDRRYNVHACINLAADLKVSELRVDTMFISYPNISGTTFRTFIEHVKAVNESDLSYPILLNEDGSIIDGKHRLAKAILTGATHIKAKRFTKDPEAGFTCV